MYLDRGRHVGVGRPCVRGSVRVDEVRSTHCNSGAFIGRLLQGDVEVEATAEVDDPEGEQEDHRGDERELGQALGFLAAKPSPKCSVLGLAVIMKCSL